MLEQGTILNNKNYFIELINSIERDGFGPDEKADLINWLENKSDFFMAPASTKYHSSYDGGLCQHSLNVYFNLVKLVETFKLDIPESSIKIAALFHDISKANYYEKYMRNVKDDNGKWVQVQEYKTKEAENRFIYGNHEQTSEFMIHSFIPLTVDESVAILHHHGGLGPDSTQINVGIIYDKYPLALLLHMADSVAAFIDE